MRDLLEALLAIHRALSITQNPPTASIACMRRDLDWVDGSAEGCHARTRKLTSVPICGSVPGDEESYVSARIRQIVP
jgi:hypothetical protein